MICIHSLLGSRQFKGRLQKPKIAVELVQVDGCHRLEENELSISKRGK